MDGKIGVWFHWGIPSAVDEDRPNDGSWYGRNMYGGKKKQAQVLCEWHTKRYRPPSEFGYEKPQNSWNQHWYKRNWEIVEKYDPDMFNHDSGSYPKNEFPKFISEYINRDLKENNGKQTVIFSTKNPKLDRSAFTYNLERGGAGEIKAIPWMWATDLSGNWFYRKNAVNKMSIPVMVANAVDAISKNGVVMLNVALKGDGTIQKKQINYLTAFGDFLKINGEGIYGSRPWKVFGEGTLEVKDGRQGENHNDYSQEDIRFTTKEGVLYAFVLAPPTKDILIKTLAERGVFENEIDKIELMGSSEKIRWKRTKDALIIKLPKTLPGELVNGFRILPAN